MDDSHRNKINECIDFVYAALLNAQYNGGYQENYEPYIDIGFKKGIKCIHSIFNGICRENS